MHMLMLNSRARCKGFPTVVNNLATRLVHSGTPGNHIMHWKPRLAHHLASQIYYAYLYLYVPGGISRVRIITLAKLK
jgi:hypothetical protein